MPNSPYGLKSNDTGTQTNVITSKQAQFAKRFLAQGNLSNHQIQIFKAYVRLSKLASTIKATQDQATELHKHKIIQIIKLASKNYPNVKTYTKLRIFLDQLSSGKEISINRQTTLCRPNGGCFS